MILIRSGATPRRRNLAVATPLRFDLTLSTARDWLRDTAVLVMTVLDRRVLITLGMLVALMVSAFAAVYAVQETRERYSLMETLASERDALESEWSRLVLEEGAWSSNAWIEQSAAERYGLRIPEPEQVKVVHQ